ncbi:MAG: HDOD domain-containing protein [Terracidiphilus sp.]|jgi:EAL and modified HD-GYP domain-containing signal transduction protein
MIETAAFHNLDNPSKLKRLTGKLIAFVPCAVDALNERLAQVLPPTLTVLEITACHEAPFELAAACEKLKTLGFRFALDEFIGQPKFEPLLEFADYIKMDFDQSGPEERRDLFQRLRGKPVVPLARNLATQKDYVEACQEGFALFEGYWFCQPIMKRNRRPPASQLLRIEILQALLRDPLELVKLGELVKRDGPLTYQLLRVANSPLWASRQRVESIHGALLAVGDDAFRRIATMAIAAEFNGDQPAELLCMALVRGRFCELAGLIRGLDPFGQYLLGLFSLLPAMQGLPMSELVPVLAAGAEIGEALMGTKNPERVLLEWLESFERGDWAGCDAAAQANGLNQEELVKIYLEAVAWTEAALHSDDER